LEEFPLRAGLIYLNHAAVGVWPRRTSAAVQAFAEENMLQGAADYSRWLGVERDLRSRLVCLLGAGASDDIALVKNTSEGLSLLAYGLDWKEGDNIVSARGEFPSNRIVWESLRPLGVHLRLADITGPDPEAALVDLCDERTRLLAVSSVQYGTGLRLNLKRLGRFCRDRGILFCIDAIQSLGALVFDARACHADVVVADGHKWMLGPEGLAVFYTHPRLRERLRLLQYGWHMVEHAGDFERLEWRPAESARRFEPGSPNMLGIHALHASLGLLLEVGMRKVETELLARTRRLLQLVAGEERLQLLSPPEPERLAGIVTFRRRDLDAGGHAALHRHLTARSVICALRGGGLRFSPHFYTPMADLERAVAEVCAFPGHD
jgi:Selenocysteine lyase